MSWKLSAWAKEQCTGSPFAKSILMCIGDSADAHNHDLWPSQALLAADAEVDERTLREWLKRFERWGLIRRERRKRADGYRAADRIICNPDVFVRDGKALLEAEKRGNLDEVLPEFISGKVPESYRKPVQTLPEVGADLTGSPCTRIEPTNNLSSTDQEERERASADASGEGEEGKPDPATVPGRAEFEKRVMRLCNGTGFGAGPWPDWDTSSPGWIGRQFAKLSEEDRQHAERWRDAYLRDLATRKRKPVPVGVFLKDRLWEGLDPELLLKASRAAAQGAKPAELAKPEGWAVGHGPVWAVALFEELMRGPDRPHPAGEGGIWFPGLIRTNWPRLAALGSGRGFVAPERLGAMKDRMEFVPSGSEMWAAWEAERQARGWPDWPRKDGMEGLYFPKGGTEGLEAFTQAMAGHNSEAAE